MGRWDLYLKTLVWENPQDFVSLLLNGARYLGRREGQFQTREIRSDGMIEAEYEGQALLIHVEFQVQKEEKIGERLLGYSYEATRLYELPVLSCVIYLKRVANAPQPPYEWNVPGRGSVMAFDYVSIELATTPVEKLAQTQLVGLFPLLLLAQGGATREVLDQAITRLKAAGKAESLEMLRMIAGMVFEKDDDLKWIEWRFANMQEFFESSWTYQQTVKKAELKGLEQGRTQGIEAGIRQSIEMMVQTRFPSLLELLHERLEQIRDQEVLRQVLVAMSAATTERKARRYLLALSNDKEQ